MSKKHIFLGISTWLGIITLPYLIRKWTEDESKFTGSISTLNSSPDKSIGYYLLPGLTPITKKLAREVFQPKNYDFNLVEYGRQDYNLSTIARAISNHIRHLGYRKVRIITIGISDHILAFLDYTLSDLINDDRIEIIAIDSLPSPDFISRRHYQLLSLIEPGVMSLRILFGWLAELPFIRFKHHWRSPALLAEQLSSIASYAGDYSQEDIVGCVKAVIKNGEAFYDPENISDLLDATFNFIEDDLDDPPCNVFYNYLGEPGDLAGSAEGCHKVFKDLKWNF